MSMKTEYSSDLQTCDGSIQSTSPLPRFAKFTNPKQSIASVGDVDETRDKGHKALLLLPHLFLLDYYPSPQINPVKPSPSLFSHLIPLAGAPPSLRSFAALSSHSMSALQASLLLFRPAPSSLSPFLISPPTSRSSNCKCSLSKPRSHLRLSCIPPRSLPSDSAQDSSPASDPNSTSDNLSAETSSEAAWEANGTTLVNSGGKDPNLEESKDEVLDKVPLLNFLIRVLESALKGLESALKGVESVEIPQWSSWWSWWPFWRHEKMLQRLIEEADANPRDASKQSILLAELNKHRFSCSIAY